MCIYAISSFLQAATEKHKINVPETMNEFLDMSDDEGKWVRNYSWLPLCGYLSLGETLYRPLVSQSV